MTALYDRSSGARADLAIAVALLVATGIAFALLPNALGDADEAYFLVHTKRVLSGQAIYRDFNEQYTPFSYYLMAIPFGLFGVNIVTAKFTMAMFHGGTVALLFGAGRRLGVRRGLAAAGALMHLGLCLPAWPMASGHWIATFFIALILFELSSPRWRARRELAVLGVAAGGLIGVQHHKGIPIAFGIGLILVANHFTSGHRTTSERESKLHGLRRVLIPYLVGVAAVVATMLIALGLQGSAGELFEQLIIEPFTGYRAVNPYMPWAHVESFTRGLAQNTVVPVLKYVPVLIPIGMIRAIFAWRRGDAEETRKLSILVLYTAVCGTSVLYRADFIHVAFIAAPFFVFLAETIQWAIRSVIRIELQRLRHALEVGIALALCVAIGAQLQAFVARWQERYPYSAETDFGRIDFKRIVDVDLVNAVRAELAEHPVTEIFCYPACASMYLMAGASNPTRYDLVFFGMHGPREYREIISTLEERSLVYVVTGGFVKGGDRFMRYLSNHFECAPKGSPGRSCRFYRRKGAFPMSRKPPSPRPLAGVGDRRQPA